MGAKPSQTKVRHGTKGKPPAVYFGLRAIAKRLNINQASVMRLYVKEHLPMVRQPCSRKYSRLGWIYYIDETLLAIWFGVKSARQRKEYIARSPAARRRTVREAAKARGRKAPAYLGDANSSISDSNKTE